MPKGAGNFFGIRRFEAGRSLADQLTAGRLNSMLDALDQCVVRFGKNIYGTRTTGGTTINARGGTVNNVAKAAWPWKLYGASAGASGAIRVNGGDGFVPSLNGFVAVVNGTPADETVGTPPAYPTLAISGNGYIYAFVESTLNEDDTVTIGSLNVYYSGTLPSPSGATPAVDAVLPIATITDYKVEDGIVSFKINQMTSSGWDTLIYCSRASIQMY